jgi:hypothetical protein
VEAISIPASLTDRGAGVNPPGRKDVDKRLDSVRREADGQSAGRERRPAHHGGSIMAFRGTVNDSITDSVTEIDTELLCLAPAVAMGELYVATSQALANAANNATNAQQNTNLLAQAVTTTGVAWIHSLAPK